ncbi:MAG: 3'-5' exonuclease [Dehalococcoidales bacterium]|nr:3'-5' exonuclease [Dehalococcoidales bacterium]
MKIFIVDTETDNVKPQLANILEIGMASLDLETGKIELLFDTLICPPGPETWTNCWFMNHCGLDPEFIRTAPKFTDIKTGIEAYLSFGPITAFNLSFDLQVLYKHGVRAGHTWPCLMLTTKDILKLPGRYGDWKYPKFSEAYNWFFPETPFEEKHRAGHDAIHEAKLAYALYKRGYFNRRVK